MNSVIVSCSSCGQKNKIPADKQHLQPKCGKCGSLISLAGKAVPVEIEDSNFQNFINGAGMPVMVDFFSPTCGPCQMMSPIVNSLAQRFVNRGIVAKIDTSENQRIFSQFNIRGVPSFLFFKNGKLVDQVVGGVPENVLAQKLSSLL
ncbi:MAG: thioredoxin family protein [Desulfobulbaceae bacterium]|nr:thioredoxin family protein [Desulfobulbaceae bacterium]